MTLNCPTREDGVLLSFDTHTGRSPATPLSDLSVSSVRRSHIGSATAAPGISCLEAAVSGRASGHSPPGNGTLGCTRHTQVLQTC